MVLVPFLVHPNVLSSNHHIARHWCMLFVSPEGCFVFGPSGGSGEYLGTVRIAIQNWLGLNHGMMDGGASTMVLQGGRSNCVSPCVLAYTRIGVLDIIGGCHEYAIACETVDSYYRI